MNTSNLTEFGRANAALRIKDYQRAIELYDVALIQTEGSLQSQIINNRELAIRKLGMSATHVHQQLKLGQLVRPDYEVNTIIDEDLQGKDKQYHSNDFDPDYYLSKYSDLRDLSMDIAAHYALHGKSEGRRGSFSLDSIAQAGCMSYNPAMNTVMIVCHEASRTGAPILGLRIAEAISAKFNVVLWLGKHGPLAEEFRKYAFLLIDHDPGYTDIVWSVKEIRKRYRLSCAILNSAATSRFASALFELKVPSVALVHEYADYMGGEVMQVLATANRVIFPAKGVKQSADDLSLKSSNLLPRQTAIRNQGMCILPSDEKGVSFSKEDILMRLGIREGAAKPLVVMGCGWVQIRKGVEYFIHAAQLCKQITQEPIRFIWIGGGFNPLGDLQYSAWLQSQVKHSGLEDDLFFFDETKDLSPFFKLADVFFLSSRLDPFPNVAIDAVKANVPIVAFDRATGFTDFIESHPAVGAVVPYLDVHAAAKSLIDLAKQGKTSCSVHEQALIDNALSFNGYIEFLQEQCRIAIKQQSEIEAEAALLERSKLMTSGFHASGIPNYINYKTWINEHTLLPALSDEYVYVARWARGFLYAKSRVGFSDAIAEQQLDSEMLVKSRVSPLARWIETGKPFNTHQTCELQLSKKTIFFKKSLKIAIHIHAHYVDGLHMLLSRMNSILPYVEIFITTTSAEKLSNILDVCRQISELHGTNFIFSCTVTPNVGRDIGPFIMTLKDFSKSYDVVGHFHIKGTKQLEESIVKQWQNFLFDTLLGLDGEAACEIFEKFEKIPHLGLVFQEDPCLPSWGKNYEYALNLATELGLADQLPRIPEYPTGNMFWVRPAALSTLFKKDWQWEDFPSEPVPYDGTVLHAIERITPSICEGAGYYWLTVRNPNALRYTNYLNT
jgi:hypothetical protein